MHVQHEPETRTAAEAEARARLAWQWLLGDERGRYIARRVLTWSGVDDTGTIGPLEQMAASAGSRMVGGLLKAMCRKYDPDGWVHLECEYVAELTAAARREEEAGVAKAAENQEPKP